MPTINERLVALEAAVTSLTGGTATTTVTVAAASSSQDAQQNSRLANLESQLSSATSSLATLTAGLVVADADLQAQITALSARVEVLEGKPGGTVAYVRDLAQSLGQVGAENIVTELTTAGTADAYADIILAETSLVGYWRLGESAGGTAVNAEGTSAIDGTYSGSTITYGVTGAISGDSNTAVDFDGGTGKISIPDNAVLDVGDTFSIEFWIKRNSIGTWQWVCDKGRTGGSAFAIFFDTGNDLVLASNTNTDNIIHIDAFTDTTSWHHVVFTKDGATVAAYLDGDSVGVSGVNQTLGSSSNPLYIGASSYWGDDELDASLDEFAVYNTALSAYAVGQHFTGTAGGGGGASGTVNVSSVADLLYYLGQNDVTEIIVANGTYTITSPTAHASNSLWIGSAYAARTTPVLVRAATTGSVTFDGDGMNAPSLMFEQGACYQTWQGFVFADSHPLDTACIVFGGYTGYAPAHHITLHDVTISSTVTGNGPTGLNDHGVYFSRALSPGVNNITLDGLTIDNPDHSLYDGIVFWHHETGNPNANNVTITGLDITGCAEAVQVSDSTVYGVTISGTIDSAYYYGVRYEAGTVTFSSVTTTASGYDGFYSSKGTYPSVPGCTFISCSFD